jgi:hypothetical protein
MAEAQTVEKSAGNVVTSENLVEWNMNRLGLAADEDQSEAVVDENPTEPVDTDSESGQSEEDPETKTTEERKQNPKLEKRFSELTKARKLAEENAASERQQRETLEARLREYEEKSAPAQQDSSPIGNEPRADQFDDAFEYAKALAEWSAEKALYDRDQQDANRKAQEAQDKVLQSWRERLEKAKETLPDFDDMVASATVQIENTVRDAILESDVGPQILYELASDEEYAQKVAAMPVAKALKEIGKLEARLEKQETVEEKPISKPVVQKSNAPAPISPIRATGSVMEVPIDSKGEFHGSFQAWKAARKAGKIR